MREALLAILLLMLLCLAFLTRKVGRGKGNRLRPLPAVRRLPGLMKQSLESGHPIHLSVGVQGVGGAATAETWAGLALLSQVADLAAAYDSQLTVTVADATVLPIAQDILQRAYSRHGNLATYEPTQVRLIAPDPVAYATGVMGILEREPLAGSMMVGSFGDEYLFMGETGARLGIQQVAGAADPRTLPFLQATADATLLGEEIFAAGPHASQKPVQTASLLAEDWARWAVIAGIVIIAILKLIL